jgi:hypothetical protein
LLQLVSRIELGYNRPRIFYTYPMIDLFSTSGKLRNTFPHLGGTVSQKPPAADVERFLCMLRVDSKGGDLDLQSYRHSYPSLHRHRRQHQASTAISQRDAISTGTASRDLKQSIQAQNGYVFQNDGDSLVVGFHSALEALKQLLTHNAFFKTKHGLPHQSKCGWGFTQAP